MTFREFFQADDIAAHRPQDGQWLPPLEQPAPVHKFYYNLAADGDKGCRDEDGRQRACYRVYFRKTSYGPVQIGFDHVDTDHDDRFKINQGIEKLTGRSPAQEQMYTVLKAVADYLRVKNPEQIFWSPTVNVDSKNPEAREKVYRLWAIRHLMGRYVPTGPNTWTREDVYDRQRTGPAYDPERYPPTRKGYDTFVKNLDKFEESHENFRGIPLI